MLQCLAHLHGPDFDPDSDLVSPAGVLQEEFQEIRAALLQNQECPPPKLDLLRAEKSFPTEHPIWKTLIFLLPLVPEATPWTIPQSPKSSRVGPTTAFPATSKVLVVKKELKLVLTLLEAAAFSEEWHQLTGQWSCHFYAALSSGPGGARKNGNPCSWRGCKTPAYLSLPG